MSRSRRLTPLVPVALLLVLTGCAAPGPVVEPLPGTQATLRSELVFGRLKPDGSVVDFSGTYDEYLRSQGLQF